MSQENSFTHLPPDGVSNNIAYSLKTSIGQRRGNMEDGAGVFESPVCTFAIVVDGAGGHALGELAAGIALRNLPEHLVQHLGETTAQNAVRASGREVSNEINSIPHDDPNHPPLAVMALALIDRRDWQLLVASIGDARAYLMRAGDLYRLTKDQSLVQVLVENGQITDEQRYTHPQRNVVTNSLGREYNPQKVSMQYGLDIYSGDLILVCSDGLWEMVRDEEIQTILSQDRPVKELAQMLVDAANRNGGADNISAAVLRIQ